MKKRVISAIVALIIFIPLVYLGGMYFKVAASVLALLAVREFLNLPGGDKRPGYVDALIYAVTFLLTFMSKNRQSYYFIGLLFILLLVIYCNDNKKYNADDAFKLVGMIALIGSVFHEFILIRQEGLALFVYLFLITMLTDTYAQFGGMLIGKHKMAPKISPNKTWEGSITGGVFGTLCAATFYYIVIDPSVSIIGLLLVTLFLSCLGQLGDLFFSAVKRNHNIKDFSNIMPGHGGVLDRLDSTIFVVLGFLLFLVIL